MCEGVEVEVYEDGEGGGGGGPEGAGRSLSQRESPCSCCQCDHSVTTQEVGRRSEDPPPPVSKATIYVLGEQTRVTRKERDTVYCIMYWINV